jgi:hypothetical protein
LLKAYAHNVTLTIVFNPEILSLLQATNPMDERMNAKFLAEKFVVKIVWLGLNLI